jgi:flagellar biosynthesis protein FlhG
MTLTYRDQAEELRRLVRSDRAGARVVAVVSGKGGVGKTNIAVNVAICLAMQGHRVILVDADLGLANADVLLDVRNPYNLSHVLAGRREIEQVVIDAPGGIGLVTGASGLAHVADLSEFERQQLVGLLDRLEDDADVLLLDCAAGISRNVVAMANAADDVLLVTTPEPPAMTDAYAVTKVMVRQGLQSPIRVVVNMAASRSQASQTQTRLVRVAEQFLQVQLERGGYVLRDEHVPLSVCERVPVVLRYPRCPASACFLAVASRLESQISSTGKRGRFWQRVVNFFF